MPQIRPFKGVRYNKDKIRDLSRVIAPPYDVIPPKMQDELYKKDEHNIVRLILNKIEPADNGNNNRYSRSKAAFESWLKDGVLAQDEKPAVYIYSQIYKSGTRTIERTGFMGLMALDMEGRTILPHENTLLAPKLDRLNLIRSVKANLSPIFVLYDDKPHKVFNILKKFSSKDNAMADVAFDGVRHKVWAVSDGRALEAIERAMTNKDIFIADGHHRYEVARMYCNEIQGNDAPQALKENSRFMLVYFVEADERMLTILPTHRAVKDIGSLTDEDVIDRLKAAFEVERASSLKGLIARMARESGSHVFGLYSRGGGYHIFRLKKKSKAVDVGILHSLVFHDILGIDDSDENCEFVKDPSEAVGLVDSGKYNMAFFLNPTKVAEVKRSARRGERMPKKATYFYPKPLSGLVINKLY